jgi:hypothetical protein
MKKKRGRPTSEKEWSRLVCTITEQEIPTLKAAIEEYGISPRTRLAAVLIRRNEEMKKRIAELEAVVRALSPQE